MAIKNYTTSISENRTVAEIQGLLADKGASSVLIDYKDGRPEAVKFLLAIDDGPPVCFRIPCNFDGVLQALAKARYKSIYDRNTYIRKAESMIQARMVAWRIVKDWIDSQLALVEANQAQMAEVFMPYALVGKEGKTVFVQFLEARGNIALTAGN